VRRLRIVLAVALGLIVVVGLAITGVGTYLLRTERGAEWVRARVEGVLQEMVGAGGRVTVGALTLAPLGSMRLDTLAVHDSTGTLILSSGPVEARFDVLPLTERLLHVRYASITRPEAHLVADSAGAWNVAVLFAGSSGTGRPPSAAPAWRVVVDSLDLHDGLLRTERTRAPGARPDTMRFAGLTVALGASRYHTGTGSGEVVLRHLAGRSSAPPLDVRNAEGTIVLFRDSAHVELPVIRLPATVARAQGRARWDEGAPAERLAITLRSDALGFSDIAWITALVPRGEGSAVVRISDRLGGGVMRYAIDSLVARAADSELRGRFVAEVGRRVAIRDLDLRAEPLDLALVRELFGDSVPAPPWDGEIRGRIRAAGGPLDRWRLDASTLVFEDRRAGGARSRLTIAGELDLSGTTTILRPLDVRIDSLDVRTVGAVTPLADSLAGHLTGRVRLEGPLDDYRFLDLVLAHHVAGLPGSALRGSGRIAADTATTWLEADLALDRVDLASLAPAITPERIRGTVSGRLVASARGDSVALETTLEDGDARLSFTGITSLDTARLVMRGTLDLVALDAGRYLAARDLPSHRVFARAVLGIDGGWTAPEGPIEVRVDSASELAGVAIRDGRALLALEPGGIRVDTLLLDAPLGHLAAHGRLSRDPSLRDTLRFEARIDSVALLRGFLSDSLAAAWQDSLSGRALLRGLAFGSLDTLDLRTEWEGLALRAGSHAADTVRGELFLLDVPYASHGLATLDAVGLHVAGVPVQRLSAEATVLDPQWADASVRLLAGDSLHVSARAEVRRTADSLRVRLDSLDATSRTMRWRLARPSMLVSTPERLTLDSLRLESGDGARLELVARLDSGGPVAGSLRAVRVPIAHAAFTGMAPEGVEGLISIDATLAGTMDAPSLRTTGTLDAVRVDGLAAPTVALTARYDDRLLDAELRGRSSDTSATRDAFTLTAALPLDLSLRSRTLAQRKLDDDVFVRLVADGTSLGGFEALLPGVRELRGGIDADVLVSGRWGSLEPRGVILVRDGAFAVPALRTGFQDLLMDVALTPDSVIFHRVRLSDERAPGDSASLEGVFFRRDTRWNADLRTFARNLRVIDDPRLAEADVSWQLRLRGQVDSLLLGGEVTVPNANAFIGRQRAILDVEPAATTTTVVSRYVPRIDQLTIRLGNEVRLRSPEANVQLTGDIAVTGSLTDPNVRGEILATRGTYRLDLGPLQRTFHVDSGVVRLNGPMDIPATLDIHTSYLVRQAEREDVKIGARLVGTVREPRLVLSSSDLGTAASETEIISYLLFGSPSFALDNNGTWAVRTATAALVPSLGGAVERALGGRLPFISELQVTTVAGNSPTDFTLNSFDGLLNSLALTAGTQLGTDSYLNLSGGVCRGEKQAASSLARWFGVAVEYRPREKLSALLSLNPGSSPCNRVGTFSQIYQFGLDLYRDWRW